MKIIFLDIDGVLNYVYTKAFAPSGCIGVAKEPLDVLKELVEQTDARIVLTSTWKRGWSRDPELCSRDGEYLNKKLGRVGIRIFDKTTDHMFDRGKGISTWLSRHPEVDGWVVLDDDMFEDYASENILPHLVTTNFYTGGLRPEMISVCIEILNGGVTNNGNQN